MQEQKEKTIEEKIESVKNYIKNNKMSRKERRYFWMLTKNHFETNAQWHESWSEFTNIKVNEVPYSHPYARNKYR